MNHEFPWALTFIIALLFTACTARAVEAPEVIGLHLATAHERGGYESVTPGVYARWHDGLTLGAYRNSEGRGSAYAAWTFGDTFALTVGGVTGYRRAVMPLVVPSVRIPIADGTSVRLSYIPKYEKGSAALHLSIERRF